MKTHFLIVFLLAVLPLDQNAFATTQDTREALDTIADFADRFCKEISLKGSHTNIELSGSTKADLRGLLKKIADLELNGDAALESEEFEGVLQQDLVKALENSTDCRLEIWKDLKNKLLPQPDASQATQNNDEPQPWVTRKGADWKRAYMQGFAPEDYPQISTDGIDLTSTDGKTLLSINNRLKEAVWPVHLSLKEREICIPFPYPTLPVIVKVSRNKREQFTLTGYCRA